MIIQRGTTDLLGEHTMYKNTRMLIPAALAAGAFLLTACDVGATAAGQDTSSSTTSSTAGDATGAATPGDSPEGEPTGGSGSDAPGKDCGNSAVNNGPTLRLVPDKGTDGYLTCDQVRAVWDKFTGIAAQGGIPAEGVTVDNDWQCVPKVDKGDTVGADCFTPAVPDANNPVALKFHAELVS